MTTAPGSSKRPGSTSALSTGWPRRRRRESSTTRCSHSIRIGSTPVHSGRQRVHSSRRKERLLLITGQNPASAAEVARQVEQGTLKRIGKTRGRRYKLP